MNREDFENLEKAYVLDFLVREMHAFVQCHPRWAVSVAQPGERVSPDLVTPEMFRLHVRRTAEMVGRPELESVLLDAVRIGSVDGVPFLEWEKDPSALLRGRRA